MSGHDAPELLVVVDTEEEFDWTRPFDRAAVATSTVLAQERVQRLYDELGLVPTYVTGYPITRDPVAVAYLKGLQDSGRAEIGAHLHPWVTPPHREEVSTRNSYACNLPAALEAAKIEALTEALTESFARRPTVFKAGRYGFGPATKAALVRLGYAVDCSLLPRYDLRGDGGPDFRRAPDEPFWLDASAGLLEVPLTTGFLGAMPFLGRVCAGLFDDRRAAAWHLPGLLARFGLVSRSRLTPEGIGAAEQCRLLDRLVRGGRRTFTLAYHSPSLAPGHTPYVANGAELDRFIATITQVLTHFRDALGGRFTTLGAVHARMRAARTGSERPPVPAPGDQRAGAGDAVVGAGAAARG